ncbi:MAG: glycosyltransferase family 25 protein [Acetobacteraceae bacterium]|nr:glycosyltransferase family 25 protein [Acetobacteraceae bacterium]
MTDTLQREALAARAAGEHGRAVELWRAVLAETPDEWRVALELKRDLKAGWHYPESDPQFRRAAASLPDEEWLAHYAALYAYHGEDLETLDQRARTVLERQPGHPAVLAILGDVASQRRDWSGAQAAFALAAEADPRAEYRLKRDTAAMYLRLAPCLSGAQPASVASYAIGFVNLDRNPEREAELRRQFAGSAPPLHRSAGVEGRRLPAAAVERLGGDTQMRGTLGCFLSHAGAWEAMLARGDRHCLIVEDDVIPLLDLPANLAGLALPEDFDIVFVNDRIAPRLDPAATTGFRTLTLVAAMHAFPPEDNAPGGDGYIVSREGARKLLDWVAEDGFGEDVDWRLIAYGLSPDEIAGLPRPSHAGPWLDRVGRLVGRAARLRAFVLHPPLIRTVGVSSDREDENRLHAAGAA